jgi:nucleotide-binding universal stress UspA family protein
VRILVWVTEGTWPACVDAVRPLAGEVTLLHVVDGATAAALSAPVGLLGRSGSADEAGFLLARAERELLDAAAARLGRPAGTQVRQGRPEREVVAACANVDLLVLARDGDRSRLGPRSLGPHTRFVVDHAPCQILLVWPETTPGLGTLPPPPPHDQIR